MVKLDPQMMPLDMLFYTDMVKIANKYGTARAV
jgi:hypothetical protein